MFPGILLSAFCSGDLNPYCQTFVSSAYVSPSTKSFTGFGCAQISYGAGVEFPVQAAAQLSSTPGSPSQNGVPAKPTSSTGSGGGIAIGTCNGCNVGNNDNQTENQPSSQGSGTSSSKDSGLSKGDIAGIIIGTLAAVAGIAGVFVARYYGRHQLRATFGRY
jgi:hypothetical protein